MSSLFQVSVVLMQGNPLSMQFSVEIYPGKLTYSGSHWWYSLVNQTFHIHFFIGMGAVNYQNMLTTGICWDGRSTCPNVKADVKGLVHEITLMVDPKPTWLPLLNETWTTSGVFFLTQLGNLKHQLAANSRNYTNSTCSTRLKNALSWEWIQVPLESTHRRKESQVLLICYVRCVVPWPQGWVISALY